MITAMDDPDELLDLVDENDHPIGTIVREDISRLLTGETMGMVRSASVFIMNDEGKLWVPKRAPHKKIAPNGFDFSAGEHVMAGETYVQAAVRGLQEELHLTISADQLAPLGIISNRPVGLPYFNAIFLYQANDIPAYNKEDFVSFVWLTPAALLAQLKSGVLAKKDMQSAVALLVQTYNR